VNLKKVGNSHVHVKISLPVFLSRSSIKRSPSRKKHFGGGRASQQGRRPFGTGRQNQSWLSIGYEGICQN
jgi:hypothetical protein